MLSKLRLSKTLRVLFIVSALSFGANAAFAASCAEIKYVIMHDSDGSVCGYRQVLSGSYESEGGGTVCTYDIDRNSCDWLR